MPINRTPKASDYFDAEEEEVTTSNKRRYDEDEDEPRPAKKRRKARDDEERPVKKRRELDDEDDEQEEDPDKLPARSSVIQKGWAAARKAAAEASGEFTDDFKFEEDEQVVKFLENDPVTYQQHWLQEKEGKKSYVCPGEGCPLCEELGHNPSYRFAFPILNLSLEGSPQQILSVGIRLATLFDKNNNDERKGPLNKEFWSLSKTGTGRNTQHRVHAVKGRDLADDYGIYPDDVDFALGNVKTLDMSKAIQQHDRRELMEIARDLM